MGKIGVSVKIDVTKIDKQKLFTGDKGIYLDAVLFFNPDEQDQYGNNGMITQAVKKGEAKNSGAILGNCKVIWREDGQQQPQQPQQQQEQFHDDIPF
jgi:hypothetical protein